MSLVIRQIDSLAQRLDMRDIIPEKLVGLKVDAINQLPLAVGRKIVALGDLFDVSGTPDDNLIIESDSGKLDYVGANMSTGRLTLEGVTGDYAGAQLNGGVLTIAGSCGHYAGSGMQTGRLVITGNAGDYLTAPPAGERSGLRGGWVQVKGNVGKRAGECMRRGILFIEGDAGPYLGCRMIAGTLYAGGQAGDLTGHGMRRGTLLLQRKPEGLPSTFNYNGRHHLGFLSLLLNELGKQKEGTYVAPENVISVDRYVGDLACDGRGEILILTRK